jgi:hypothetical protein
MSKGWRLGEGAFLGAWVMTWAPVKEGKKELVLLSNSRNELSGQIGNPGVVNDIIFELIEAESEAWASSYPKRASA